MRQLRKFRDRRGRQKLADVTDTDELEPPEELTYLWLVYAELRNTAGGTGFGPKQIDFVHLDAYQRVRGVPLEGWEIDLILELDELYVTTYNEKNG